MLKNQTQEIREQEEKEGVDEVDSKDQNVKATNKQVRFNEKVQKMGTPESSVSKPGVMNDEDDRAKIEDVKPDLKNKELNGHISHDDEGAMDTCDEVSEIETDFESPGKQKENGSKEIERKQEELGDGGNKPQTTEDGEDASKELVDQKSEQKKGEEDSYYSDDFEASSASTVLSDKGADKKQEEGENSSTKEKDTFVQNTKTSHHGEYYDEAYACDGDKLSLHDENEIACMSVNVNVKENLETTSVKSFDEEKKFYVDEDSEDEELKKGPLQTTYEDMNIIGPLAALLMKVRRKKREMQSRLSIDSECEQDAERETSEGFSSSSSLDKESAKLGSQASLSSVPFENQLNGKKKLQPIVMDKKKKKKKNSSTSSLTDSGRISFEPNGRSRRLSDASIRSFDSHKSIEQQMIETSQDVVKAVLESQKQMAISIQQVTESSKLVVNSSKEVLESSKQVNESSKQVNESSKQVNESSKQVVESSQNAIDTAMQAILSIKQTEKEFVNLIKDDKQLEDNVTDAEVDAQKTLSENMLPETAEIGDVEKPDSKDDSSNTGMMEERTITEYPEPANETEKTEMAQNEGDKDSEDLDTSSHTVIQKSALFESKDFDSFPAEDSVNSIEDKNFNKVVKLIDTLPDADIIHTPNKSNLSELHKSNLFDFKDIDLVPSHDEISVSNELHDIIDLMKKDENVDQIDGEVHTYAEEMHIPAEFHYADYRIYYDKMEKQSTVQQNETLKELSLRDATVCSQENENAYNSSSPFVRRNSENTDFFDKESMLAKKKRSRSMPVAIKKTEIEKIKPKTFVYIAKDETLYTETVDVKVREVIIEDDCDEQSENKSSTPRSRSLPQEKNESSKTSDNSDSSILVHKSSEEDALVSCISDDEQFDNISLNTSGEAELVVDKVLLNIRRKSGHSSLEEYVKSQQVSEETKNEDTISLDTVNEAELIVENVLHKLKNENMQSCHGQKREIESASLKPITPRTDPDGQVTQFVSDESSTVKENMVDVQGSSGDGIVKSSSDDYEDNSVKSSCAGKDDSVGKPRPLRRQGAVQNLYEAIDVETVPSLDEACETFRKQIDDDDNSLSTSEEASLIVKRVIEGISDEESLERKDLVNKQAVNLNKNTDVPVTDSTSNAVSLNASSVENLTEKANSFTKGENLVCPENIGKETRYSPAPKEENEDDTCFQPIKDEIEENTTLIVADESKHSSNTDLQDMRDESEMSNTPNLEPIPIEKEEDRAIICPVVDRTELESHSQQLPFLVKARSGAMVVKYPEPEQQTAKEEEINSLINEEMKAMTKPGKDLNDVKDNDTPCITVTEASDVSRGSDESTVESKNRKYTNEEGLANTHETDIQDEVREQVYEGGNKAVQTTERKDTNVEDIANKDETAAQDGANEQIYEEGNKTVQTTERKDINVEDIVKKEETAVQDGINKQLCEDGNKTVQSSENESKTFEEITTKPKLSERPDSAVSLSSSSESSETDVKFFMNDEEVKYPREFQNGTPAEGTPNLLEIDGKVIDLDNLESLDKETYKKVMAVAYNIDIMSTISEEHSTSQSTAHLSNK